MATNVLQQSSHTGHRPERKEGKAVLKRLTAGLAVLGVFLAIAVPAGLATDLNQGKNPTHQGYHKPTEPKPTVVKKTNPSPTKTNGVLPFTGMDLTLMASGAILLVLVGSGLRLLVRKS
jgi:hypothetical protein